MRAPTVATARNTVANPTSKPAASAAMPDADGTIEAATGPAWPGMWRLALPSHRSMPMTHSPSESAHMKAANHIARRELFIGCSRQPLWTLCQSEHARAGGRVSRSAAQVVRSSAIGDTSGSGDGQVFLGDHLFSGATQSRGQPQHDESGERTKRGEGPGDWQDASHPKERQQRSKADGQNAARRQ